MIGEIAFVVIVLILCYISITDYRNHQRKVEESAKELYRARLEKESKKKEDEQWIPISEEEKNNEEDEEEEEDGILFG